MKRIIILCAAIVLICSCTANRTRTGDTVITKWQHGKNGAVSLTYDDGSINQFRVALPMMNELGIPATFFINTGQIAGSAYRGKFIGRPVQEIIKETASVPTGPENFYERSSAARFLGYRGTSQYHTDAGALIDEENPQEAYKVIDQLYEKVRRGDFQPLGRPRNVSSRDEGITWDDIRTYAARGHEFASHMVTHPRLAALDEANILYELEKSREEILAQLGRKHIFSAEVPYGTENERAMEYAYKVYPALRNRMPEPFLKELNRASTENPVSQEKEYVQWQRGATTKTPLPLMKSWIDTTAARDNIWLVLVFHGVDGIGWEALDSDLLRDYFNYIESHSKYLWTATFGDVAKYMRERMNATVITETKKDRIDVNVSHTLDNEDYDLPLTLKTCVTPKWKEVQVRQGETVMTINPEKDSGKSFVMYQVIPNAGTAELTRIR